MPIHAAPTPPAAPTTIDLATATRACNAWIELDAGALASNVAAIRTWLGPGRELISIVKANAYGHGVASVAPVLESAGADRFATVWTDEAVRLRELGARLPIIVLGHAFPDDARRAVAHDLTLTVHSRALGLALSRAAREAGRTARVHIKVDTGLHRFGVTPGEAIDLAQELRALPGIEVEGLWTHMANADEEDDSFSEAQLERFRAVANRLGWIPYRHVANSATALRRPEDTFHGVRVGLAQWGYRPDWTPGPELTPVLSLRARLARVSHLAPGEGVAYGLTWRASEPSRIGLVPVGYGDGWRRSLGNHGEVLVHGHRAPMVGRVMMDHFIVDLTGIPGVREGDVVTLLGRDGDECITADDIAAQTGTIAYEVLAALQARLPRIAHRDGLVDAT